ncbi:NifU family SUF system FeS assembly protein [Paucilactobacillus vaccinostercus DSM 20634]|jgi:nitrogen fixation NifU-like protein|uniref:NifU family SUF system FeS assembly protein n=1 Tax=Paucilactobacillus vaccinostercus DSM 20634 TaxID=1423813 RepID=A0A0R2A4K5_9LACO|nr:SUF system NifU family Fe-S cluster assembly protein [Paucilactobacillus vaccinostercus]KRM61599.1 NifU family SUF system FeS assembly protein [Paucilactobacillus vaccinostercus DSM 20634]RRG10604.1 MAG: SUF system NifU family Fe-S cluster assembly protein [Lactobacillus sp.]
MGLSSLNHLYREVVLDHSQHPRHHGALPAATDHLELRNPTCGDVIDVQAQIKDGVITDLAFDGSGCTISQASASMMTTVLIGQPVDHARELILNFSNLITGKEIDAKMEDELEDAAVIGSVAEFPTRIKCAALAWHALDELLDKKGAAAKDD